MKAYQDLTNIITKASQLSSILKITNWDFAAMMPTANAESRGAQMAELGSVIHEIMTQPKVSELIELIEQDTSTLDAWQLANFKIIKKNHISNSDIDSNLLAEHSLAASECEMIWRSARIANDFALVKPYMQKLLDLVNEIADIKSAKFGCSKYDILVDQYDTGRTTDEVQKIFGQLKSEIPNLLQEIIVKQKSRNTVKITDTVPAFKQKELATKIAAKMGFDFTRGRLDESAHPFCFGISGDVRITTRYDESNFLTAIAGTIHEVGHALYELSLPTAYNTQPVGRFQGLGIHESQSLIMEMQACLSREFMEYYAQQIRDVLHLTGPAYTPENLYEILTKVQPGLIRVDADEVSYPLHVIMRSEIEQDLLNGNLALNDLPEVWRHKMQQYLGVSVPDDKDGCLQDIHWFKGSYGYFPSYVFGAMTAAQLMHAAQQQDPFIKTELRHGDFNKLNNFLDKSIRQFGSLKSYNELMQDATGSVLNSSIYINYLRNRYLG